MKQEIEKEREREREIETRRSISQRFRHQLITIDDESESLIFASRILIISFEWQLFSCLFNALRESSCPKSDQVLPFTRPPTAAAAAANFHAPPIQASNESHYIGLGATF